MSTTTTVPPQLSQCSSMEEIKGRKDRSKDIPIPPILPMRLTQKPYLLLQLEQENLPRCCGI